MHDEFEKEFEVDAFMMDADEEDEAESLADEEGLDEEDDAPIVPVEEEEEM
jgi:hypothetical protein